MACTSSRALLLLLLGSGISQPVLSAQGDDWQFEFTPYLFAAGMEGEVGLRGVTADVDLSFSDILDQLDQGFMGLFQARRGPWMYGFEGIYLKLEDEGAKSVTGPFGRVAVDGALAVTSKAYVYQGTIGYRLLDSDTRVDLLAALRYTKVEADASVELVTTPGIVFPGGAREASGSESWTDGVVGALVQHSLSDNAALLGYVDVGGGGSDFTYQVAAGVNWEFSDGFTAKLGYRRLDWDYEDDGFVWDIANSGPYIGLGIRF